jgi:hypothetical protein
MNPLVQLRNHGQSYWLDDLTRQMIASGELARDIPASPRWKALAESTQLENQGIQKFIKAFDSILEQLAKQRERALSRR